MGLTQIVGSKSDAEKNDLTERRLISARSHEPRGGVALLQSDVVDAHEQNLSYTAESAATMGPATGKAEEAPSRAWKLPAESLIERL